MLKVGDKVRIKDYNDYWDGTEAEVTAVAIPGELDWREFPYTLRALTDTPLGHRKAGEDIGRWGDNRMERVHSPQDEALAKHFPGYMDVFKTDLTGIWAVLDGDGMFYRILQDGTMDKH